VTSDAGWQTSHEKRRPPDSNQRPGMECLPMSESRFSSLIKSYLDGPALLRRVVSDMTPQQLKARPASGKWSTLEVVCHLGDSEQAWCHRMKRVIAEERPLLIGYDETRFTAALYYHERNLDEELTLLETTRKQMARILSSIEERVWSRTGVHNERGLMTLQEMLQAEVEHIPHHVNHIVEKRGLLGLGTLV
jgi:uncharacterized damage-inducible protein DinB